MSPIRARIALAFAAGLLLPAADGARAADGVGALRPVPRGGRVSAVKPDATLPAAEMRALPKPTAAQLAEKRRLEHDLRICIGC